MLHGYNIMKRPRIEYTEHGIINREHRQGITYVTHRRPEHILRSHGAFAISKSELEIAEKKGAVWITIIYHETSEITRPYRMTLKKAWEQANYIHEQDEQKIIPIIELQENKEGEWVRPYDIQ